MSVCLVGILVREGLTKHKKACCASLIALSFFRGVKDSFATRSCGVCLLSRLPELRQCVHSLPVTFHLNVTVSRNGLLVIWLGGVVGSFRTHHRCTTLSMHLLVNGESFEEHLVLFLDGVGHDLGGKKLLAVVTCRAKTASK